LLSFNNLFYSYSFTTNSYLYYNYLVKILRLF